MPISPRFASQSRFSAAAVLLAFVSVIIGSATAVATLLPL